MKISSLARGINHPLSTIHFTLSICLFVAGCSSKPSTVLGEPPRSPPQTIVAAREARPASVVTLEGVLIEKCPVAGCWFRLRDQSGVIKVDTKAAGFVVTSVPLNTRLTVVGKMTAPADEPTLEATGLRY